MPIPPELMATLLSKLKERAGLVSSPTPEDISSRLKGAAEAEAAGPPPRSIMYYGGVIKFAGNPILKNLTDLGVKTKAKGDVIDRMRSAWRKGR